MKDFEQARVTVGVLQAFRSLDEVTQRTVVVCLTVVIAALLMAIPACVGAMETGETERLKVRVQDNQHWRDSVRPR